MRVRRVKCVQKDQKMHTFFVRMYGRHSNTHFPVAFVKHMNVGFCDCPIHEFDFVSNFFKRVSKISSTIIDVAQTLYEKQYSIYTLYIYIGLD